MSNYTLEDLFEVGAHFGHQTKYWNPKMEKYIFGVRNKIHIHDLNITLKSLTPALDYVKSLASKNNKILFVGTKRTASKIIQLEAERCGMPYVNQRWLGGMLTNYKTIRSSIKRLEDLLLQKEDGTLAQLTKKEGLKLQREIDKLLKSIGGVREMGGLPDALFVIDVKLELIAVTEAQKMGIPIVGIVDTNSNPEGIDFIIPANDDSMRSINLFSRAISDACLEGAELSTGLSPQEQSGPSITRKTEDVSNKEKAAIEEQEVDSKEPESISVPDSKTTPVQNSEAKSEKKATEVEEELLIKNKEE